MFELTRRNSFLWAKFNIIICFEIDLLDKYTTHNSVFSIKVQFQDLSIYEKKSINLTINLITTAKKSEIKPI